MRVDADPLFELRRGQVFRVIAVEGKQVGDMTLLSRHDLRETFSSHMTAALNGSLRKAARLYSRPPFANVMLTVTDDPVGVHWIHGRCTRMWYRERLGAEDRPNCHDNLLGALGPYGIGAYDLPLDTFNISYGASFGPYAKRYFRIGHLGDINDGWLAGVLAVTEMALAVAGIPHKKGGVQAAMDYLVSVHRSPARAAAE